MQAPPEISPSPIEFEHLRLLALFYKISGIVTIVIVSLFTFHFIFIATLAFLPASKWNQTQKIASSNTNPNTSESQLKQQEPPPRVIFQIFAGILGLIILAGWTLGGFIIYAGQCIKKRKHYIFIFVMACIKCIFIPYGTILSICTFQVITKPHIKKLFYP